MSQRPMCATSAGRHRAAIGLVVALIAIVAFGAGAAPFSSAAGAQRPQPGALTPTGSEATTVTLITGDVVHVIHERSGRRTVSLEPRPDGTVPLAAVTDTGKHLYVVPQTAMPLLAAHKLDLDLFDVAGLIRQGYGDAHRSTLPVIVDYGHGLQAGADARTTTFAASDKTLALPLLGAAAFSVQKHQARGFWASLTSQPDSTGAPTALSGGATHVDLDGRVHTLVDPDVAQIHAPEAWAAGYDGSGTTVAVLDTGYDPTHPDLSGQITGSQNFTGDDSVVDGNGHGTHVASTIAGTGAAENHLHGGVAPGTKLLIGKVLDHTGFGDDSWVMAGMEWAVAQHADIVNMSLGGAEGDGTDPISKAVNDLSAASPTLFVIAAGNDGDRPSTITEPGAADAALTVGAVDGGDQMAFFSSRGPRLGDGAVKPDLTAPGVGIVAARAAGTSLGDPVDQYYTSLSGTSMATPHVVGVAAILKQEHPSWDGERLKAVLTSSTVPVPGATAFDTGSGRVDAEQAIHENVFSSGSLNLGFYPYPQSQLSPSSTPLTYTNLGAKPVKLTLAVGSEDGVSDTPPGVSLSAQTLTVPAGGQASVNVLFDPSQATPGTYSGVVLADPGVGQVPVRTAFGFELETEHYNVTVKVKPRTGTQQASHTVSMSNLSTGDFYQQIVDGRGTQSVTFRVTPGAYSVGSLGFELAADGAMDGVATGQPSLDVSQDMTITLDGTQSRAFTYAVDRPVIDIAQTLQIFWTGDTSGADFLLTGGYDRLYTTPATSAPGSLYQTLFDWRLSQPDAELTAGKTVLALRLVGATTQPTWSQPVPKLNGRFAIADAGEEGNLDTAKVKGAVALVATHCDDLTATAAALRAAGAVAMVAYASDGQTCAGTMPAPGKLPAFQAKPYEVPAVLGPGAKHGRLVTHKSPAYEYVLERYWAKSVPAGAVLNGHDGHVAALTEHYNSLGPDASAGHTVSEMYLGWAPNGAANYGLFRTVPIPSTVVHYVSPDVRWERDVQVLDAAGNYEANLFTPPAAVAAGTTSSETWFRGPMASNVSPLLGKLGWDSQPNRQGDTMYLYMPPWADADGHLSTVFYSDEFDGRVYMDNQLIMEGDDPFWIWGDVPAAAHHYRVVFASTRQNAFWQRSAPSRTTWKFVSRHAADHAVLPLMTVNYNMALSSTNTARAGTFTLPVTFGMPFEVTARPVKQVSVSISWNAGKTWTNVPASCSYEPQSNGAGRDTTCTVTVNNVPGGSASLKVDATDTAGRSVTQTITNAYGVS